MGGRAPDARKFDKRVAVGGYFAAEVANEDFADRNDILRLRSEQPDRLDVLLQPILAKIDHLLRRLHLLKQPPRRLVHPDVGRLRREHDRDEQLIGVAIFELGLGAGVELGEAAVEFENIDRKSTRLNSSP